MKTPYLDEMINELDGYIGSSDNYLSKRGNEKLTELKAVKEQLLLHNVVKSLPTKKEILLQAENYVSENKDGSPFDVC